jgi:hypothetical protein
VHARNCNADASRLAAIQAELALFPDVISSIVQIELNHSVEEVDADFYLHEYDSDIDANGFVKRDNGVQTSTLMVASNVAVMSNQSEL